MYACKEIRKQLRHLFRTADLNGDGHLTWEEFVTCPAS